MEELIDNYLLGLLSEEEKKAFELRIASDANLAREVSVQRDLMQATKLQGLKDEINEAWTQIKRQRIVKIGAVIILLVSLIVIGLLTLKSNKNKSVDNRDSEDINQINRDTTLDSINTDTLAIAVFAEKTSQNKIENDSSNQQKPSQTIKEQHPEIYKVVKENPIAWSADTLQSLNPATETISTKSPAIKIPQVSEKRNNALMSLVSTKYPEVYANIIKEFDLSDSTISTGVCEHLCNLKRATHIRIGNSERTKDFPLEHSSKLAKRKEVKELYKASLASCNCNCY